MVAAANWSNNELGRHRKTPSHDLATMPHDDPEPSACRHISILRPLVGLPTCLRHQRLSQVNCSFCRAPTSTSSSAYAAA